ncbi:MAG: hypothetical protein DSM106950_00920 [Stigonema ocellatum SAG 48.90 = DSM 106950]|nr:hypothetical protein [Stigonema ocellatum SAG 48.90 = DSM 106950]
MRVRGWCDLPNCIECGGEWVGGRSPKGHCAITQSHGLASPTVPHYNIRSRQWRYDTT